MMQGLADSTRARDGQQRMPLMSGIGGAIFVNDMTDEEVVHAAQYVQWLHAEKNNILPVQHSAIHAAGREAVPA